MIAKTEIFNHTLSEMLYYDSANRKGGDLNKSLREYQLLISALGESLSALEKGELEKFDSTVGENACQIRAIKIALIYSNNAIEFLHLHRQIALIQQKSNELLNSGKINPLLRNGTSLKQVLDEYDLNIQLTSREMFALASYLLTEMKELKDSDPSVFYLLDQSKCSPIKIQRLNPDVSYSFTTKLASHLRQTLASASVQFVRDMAEELEDPYLTRMVSEDFTVTHNALKCIPMFWTYKILLKSAQRKKIPLVAHVKFIEDHAQGHKVKHEKVFFFRPSDNLAESYIEATPNDLELQKAACVIQGVARSDSNWDQASILQSITDVILAGAADHRQYPNPDHLVPIEDAEYEGFKLGAKAKGFSLDNPTTFFIQHVYPSQVKRMLGN
jgi:hypothetical protein